MTDDPPIKPFLQPRPAPTHRLATTAAALVVGLAFPVFALAGWELRGWALGAVLWVGSAAVGWVLTRLQTNTGSLGIAGVVAFGMMLRAIAVMVVVFAVATSQPWLALEAAAVYALGYTTELGLSLVDYFGRPAL